MPVEPAAIQAEVMRRMIDAQATRIVNLASPAVGAEVNTGPSGGEFWDVLSVRFLLTTSAVVATRTPSVTFNDQDGTRYLRLTSNLGLATGSTAEYNFVKGAGFNIAGSPGIAMLPLLPYPLIPGTTIRTLTTNIDVGDQYSGVTLCVREYSASQFAALAEDIVQGLENEGVGGLV